MATTSPQMAIVDWGEHLRKSKKEFLKRYEAGKMSSCQRESFDFIRTLGKGALGRVYLAKMWESGQYYAIKVLNKAAVLKRRQTKQVFQEKRILQALNCPFTLTLNCSFQDNSHLFLTLPFVPAGDMFRLLKRQLKFSEELARFYGAQVLLALEYLHYCDIAYRDLKPENILIDQQGYVKLTDFGMSRPLNGGRAYTICGTPEFLAPEILCIGGYGLAVDWWAYGVLLFEMNSGRLPFEGMDQMETFKQIASGEYRTPTFFSAPLVDLTANLLQVDLSKRFGNMKRGVEDIKDHKWYEGTSWLSLLNHAMKAPYVPQVAGQADTNHFDDFEECVNEVAGSDDYCEVFEQF